MSSVALRRIEPAADHYEGLLLAEAVTRGYVLHIDLRAERAGMPHLLLYPRPAEPVAEFRRASAGIAWLRAQPRLEA